MSIQVEREPNGDIRIRVDRPGERAVSAVIPRDEVNPFIDQVIDAQSYDETEDLEP